MMFYKKGLSKMSSPYMIITDTTCDLPKDIITRYGIHHIAMPYTLDNTEKYHDLVLSDGVNEFYNALRNGSECHSSVPEPIYYADSLEKYISQGIDILYFTIGSELSDNYKSLVEAKSILKQKYPDNDLIVIDSKRLSASLGLMVIKAYELQQMGASLGEVYQWIEKYKLIFRGLFMVNDVFYLKRSTEAGQAIKASEAHLSMVLKVKPIMYMDNNGRPSIYDKSLGTRNAIENFAKIIASKVHEPTKSKIMICHADCLDNANKLRDKILSKAKFDEVIINSFSPVVGCNIGAGALGVAYFGEE